MAKKTSSSKGAKGASAMSLHIGLNAVSPASYGGWGGPLAACEADAKDMEQLALDSAGWVESIWALAIPFVMKAAHALICIIKYISTTCVNGR